MRESDSCSTPVQENTDGHFCHVEIARENEERMRLYVWKMKQAWSGQVRISQWQICYSAYVSKCHQSPKMPPAAYRYAPLPGFIEELIWWKEEHCDDFSVFAAITRDVLFVLQVMCYCSWSCTTHDPRPSPTVVICMSPSRLKLVSFFIL